VPAFVECIDDPAIPALQAVLQPAELRNILTKCLGEQIEGLTEVHVKFLRHHPGKRCVVDIALSTADGPLRIIGKVYARDHFEVYQFMKDLTLAGFGSNQEFQIPAPLAYVSHLHLLLQRKIEGSPSTMAFLSDDESLRRIAADRCARWLAWFHAQAPSAGPTFELKAHLVSIEQWFIRITSSAKCLGDKARALFGALEDASSSLQTNKLAAVHGDYTHHQVIFSTSSTVATDWDNHGVADPTRDVARFIVGLQRLALRSRGSVNGLDAVLLRFSETYVRATQLEIANRLPFERAAACLEHVKHDVHKRAHGWLERAEATLDEGLRILKVGV
jgi:aminoglycoside phosphotransferase (APT) family kinase protein